MKMQKGSVGRAGFVMLLVLLIAVPVHAQVSWESWVGQWFQGTLMDKGVMVNESEVDKAVGKATTYGLVFDWNIDSMQYIFLLVQFDPNTGTWMDPVPYFAQVIGGTPLNYVCYGFIPPNAEPRVPGIELFALILNVTGKDKKGELTNASATAIGGCVIYNNPEGGGGPYFAANETLKFKSAKRVPDEVLDKIPR